MIKTAAGRSFLIKAERKQRNTTRETRDEKENSEPYPCDRHAAEPCSDGACGNAAQSARELHEHGRVAARLPRTVPERDEVRHMVRPAKSALVRDVHKLVRAAGGRAGERYSQVCKLPDRRELVQAARALAHAGVHSAGRRSAVYRQRQLRRSRCDSRKRRREHGLYHRGQLHERNGRAPREKTRRQHPRLRDAAVRQH